MTRGRRAALSALVVVLVLAGSGCDARPPTPLVTEADAIARARALVRLDEPVCVLGVKAGRVRELFDGAPPSFAGREAADGFWASIERPAWRVDLAGVRANVEPDCRDASSFGGAAGLIIDRATGDLVTYLDGWAVIRR